MDPNMTLRRALKGFARHEDGAVSADFVVLTGLVISFALLFILPVLDASVEWGEYIGEMGKAGLHR